MLKGLAGLLFLVALIGGPGQTPTKISPHYNVGDAVRYTVSFDGDPNFAYVGLIFQKLGGADSSQQGLNTTFQTEHFTKVKAGVFEVDGKIPENTATGMYNIIQVYATIAPDGHKSYDASSFNLGISITNDQKYDFPPVKSVSPK
jgi:hypothetical protein